MYNYSPKIHSFGSFSLLLEAQRFSTGIQLLLLKIKVEDLKAKSLASQSFSFKTSLLINGIAMDFILVMNESNN